MLPRVRTMPVVEHRLVRLLLALAVLLACDVRLHADEAASAEVDAADGIRAVLAATWDRPDAPLRVAPVSIEGDHALAGWRQGERGGRALLRRDDGAWQVLLCGGDALLDPAVLVQAGMTDAGAKALAAAERTAERTLPREHVDAFARFGALVHMGEGGDAASPHPH